MPAYKRYLDEMEGVPLQDVWTDVRPIGSQARERLGCPTQKPEALLERILKASSNEGDLILDPFCGCGTTVQVAQRLNRRWIGIDITHLAIGLIKKRPAEFLPGSAACCAAEDLSGKTAFSKIPLSARLEDAARVGRLY